MITINKKSATTFTLNGLEYSSIYQPLAVGSRHISIISVYDSSLLLLSPTAVSDITLDGVVYSNIETLMSALIAVIYVSASGGGGGGGDFEPDGEDTIAVSKKLKLADRSFSISAFSGKGYKILRKNIEGDRNYIIESMFSLPNTVYDIRYDFELDGEVTIPDGCVLNFVGGRIWGQGIFRMTNTTLIGDVNFGVAVSGTIKNTELRGEWFSDGEYFIDTIGQLNGYNTVIFDPKKEYVVGKKSLEFNRQVTSVEGRGSVVNVGAGLQIRNTPSVTYTSYILSYIASKGDRTINVGDAGEIKKGDILVIKDNVANSFSPFRDYRQSEFIEIDKVDGNELTLKHDLFGDYPLEQTVIYSRDMMSLSFVDMVIVGDSDPLNVQPTVYFSDLYNSNISRLDFRDCTISLNLFASLSCTVDRIVTSNNYSNPSPSNYGVALTSCQGVSIRDCNLSASSHGVTLGAASSEYFKFTITRNIVVDAVIASGSVKKAGLDAHGCCEYVTFANCRTDGLVLGGGRIRVYNTKMQGAITIYERINYDIDIVECDLNFIGLTTAISAMYTDDILEGKLLISRCAINIVDVFLLFNNFNNTAYPARKINYDVEISDSSIIANARTIIRGSCGNYILRNNNVANIATAIWGDFMNVANNYGENLEISIASGTPSDIWVHSNKIEISKTVNFMSCTIPTNYSIINNDVTYSVVPSSTLHCIVIGNPSGLDLAVSLINMTFAKPNDATKLYLYDINATSFYVMSNSQVTDFYSRDAKPMYGVKLIGGKSYVEDSEFWLKISPFLSKGTTAQRPVLLATDDGVQYFDKTINKQITWSGVAWVDALGTEV